MDEELLHMGEKRMWLLEIESAPDEDTLKTVEMTVKDIGYDTFS